jgi:glucuronate isomerase
MKEFLSEDFLLESEMSKSLYFDHASKMPIIDYHCHLPPDEIAKDKNFANLTKIWLNGDHYKWRAMRTNGIDEKYITGKTEDYKKFEKWAETVPYTMRNPLYHWTHMELRNPFGITKLLDQGSAREIYDQCTELLNTKPFSARNLLRKFKVEVVCTTDDPTDTLEHHQNIRDDGFEIMVLPTFRPDKALTADDVVSYNQYLDKLSDSSNIDIKDLQTLVDALKARHDYFHYMGCRLSDHGLEEMYSNNFKKSEIKKIFSSIRSGVSVSRKKLLKFKSALLKYLAEMDHEKGWTQQFHLGALRNNNSRMVSVLGPDTGFDSIGDKEMARPLSRFLNSLDKTNSLSKTILYNLNPRDNYLFATMIGNFNDGSVPGKIQFGSGWWFLDQKDGMELQLNALSNLGLLSRFVGMLTDSRSFLSYPRHDYFRRILCNLIGNDVENGLLPNDSAWLGQMVENISYYNAKNFFNFKSK